MSNPTDSNPAAGASHDRDGMPADEQLREPSVEKEPDEEPKADEPHDSDPSHEATGIGVVPGELPDGASDDD